MGKLGPRISAQHNYEDSTHKLPPRRTFIHFHIYSTLLLMHKRIKDYKERLWKMIVLTSAHIKIITFYPLELRWATSYRMIRQHNYIMWIYAIILALWGQTNESVWWAGHKDPIREIDVTLLRQHLDTYRHHTFHYLCRPLLCHNIFWAPYWSQELLDSSANLVTAGRYVDNNGTISL